MNKVQEEKKFSRQQTEKRHSIINYRSSEKTLLIRSGIVQTENKTDYSLCLLIPKRNNEQI